MRACPLPEAEVLLKEMEKIDPASVKRAKTHFPIQKAEKPGAKDQSKARSNRGGPKGRLPPSELERIRMFRDCGLTGVIRDLNPICFPDYRHGEKI